MADDTAAIKQKEATTIPEKNDTASLSSSTRNEPENVPNKRLEETTPDEAASGAIAKDEEEILTAYPGGAKLVAITVSLMLAVFCVALDNTIISVAIPRITDQFHDLNDVGWYASSYLLTTCAFQLLFGKFYALFNIKWVFLIALFIFEVGSLVCGVAPNSTALIVGRAVAGLGSAGIFTGALVTLANTTPLEKRPVFLGLIGGMYGIASVAGPLLGGAFTDHATWRWCFYINLPLGGVTAAGLLFLLKLSPKAKRVKEPLFTAFKRLDPIGTVIFVPAIICLLLALQWGGIKYDWSDGRIIVLFILFGVFILVFIGIQILLKDNATVPTRIASQRTIAFASLFGLCIGASFFIQIYYIPIWFQAIRGTSAIRAGINSLPMILANVFAIIISGALTTKIGYYTQWFYACVVIMSVGAGLITTFTVDVSQSKWIGYQFIYGLGAGLGFQQGGVAAQAVLPIEQVPIGTATVLFLQVLGGALFVSVAQNIFTNHLVKSLDALDIKGLDPEVIINAGATTLRSLVDPARLPEVLVAYNDAIVKTFQISLIMSCLCLLGAVGIEWKSVKGKQIAAAAA